MNTKFAVYPHSKKMWLRGSKYKIIIVIIAITAAISYAAMSTTAWDYYVKIHKCKEISRGMTTVAYLCTEGVISHNFTND